MPLSVEVPEKIDLILDDAHWLLPEVILISGSIIILLADLFLKKKNSILLLLLFLVVIMLCGATMVMHYPTPGELGSVYVWNVLLIDNGAYYLQMLFLLAAILYACSVYPRIDAIDLFLALCIVLGAGIVVKSINLLVLLLGIEILSVSAYAFTARQGTAASLEAGIKYIIFGAVSTAIFLFGLSLLYGLTGDLNINSETFTERLILQEGYLLLFVFLFVLAGIFFKITAFPFHLWAPDVYQSIPSPLAAFFSVVPKLAGLGFLVKFVIVMNLFNLVEVPWPELLAGVAILTMTVGNLAALSQEDPQRMMAYSSIAQTGFFLMGIAAFNIFAYQAVLFYAGIYLFMNFLAFLLIYYYQLKFKINNIADFSGKFNSAPFQGVLLLIAMVSLTGLPPTAGFTGKLFIFSSLWQTYQETNDILYWILLLAGVLNTLISLFYYLKIPYFLIFKPSLETEYGAGLSFKKLNFLMVILVLPLLILFIWPDLLMDWINMVNFAL